MGMKLMLVGWKAEMVVESRGGGRKQRRQWKLKRNGEVEVEEAEWNTSK